MGVAGAIGGWRGECSLKGCRLRLVRVRNSGRNHGSNRDVVLLSPFLQAAPDALPIRLGPILAHLALPLEIDDRHAHADDAAQLSADEGLRSIRDGPGLLAGGFVVIGQAVDDLEQALGIIKERSNCLAK